MIESLTRRERKVIILGVLSLLVALVTYGLLKSTGTFTNEAWNLSGGIVGFLAALFSLNRVYGKPEDGMSAEEIKDADFLSEETFKIVDLRNRVEVPKDEKLTNPASKVFEVDQYRLRKLTNTSTVEFHYATTGYGIEGKCYSNPNECIWTDLTEEEVAVGQDHHLRKSYQLTIDVSNIAKNASTQLQNHLTFINAFQGKEKEWFHTHIDFPTEHLVIVILFPKNKKCKIAKALVQYSSRKPFEIVQNLNLATIREGEILYLSISHPQKGAAYQIEWDW